MHLLAEGVLLVMIAVGEITGFTSSHSSKTLLSRKKRYLIFPDGASLLTRFSLTENLIGVTDPSNWFHIIELDAVYKLPNSTRLHLPEVESSADKMKDTKPEKHFYKKPEEHFYEKPEEYYHEKPEEYYYDKPEHSYESFYYHNKAKRRNHEKYYRNEQNDDYVKPEKYYYREQDKFHNIRHRIDRRDVYHEMEGILESQGLNGRACVLRAICEVKHILTQYPKLSIFEEIFQTIFTIPPGEDNVFDINVHNYETSPVSPDDCEQWYNLCQTSLLDFAFTNANYNES